MGCRKTLDVQSEHSARSLSFAGGSSALANGSASSPQPHRASPQGNLRRSSLLSLSTTQSNNPPASPPSQRTTPATIRSKT